MTESRLVWGDGTVGVAGRWTYHFGARRRPFLDPLRTPAGHVLTVDAPEDHPWHHGLWFAIKFVDGDNFWEEVPPYGVLRHDDDPPVAAAEDADGTVTVAGWLDWVAADRETVVIRERRTITHRDIPTGYSLDLRFELAPNRPLTLDRTPFNGDWGGYGGLTFRGAPDLVDTHVTLSEPEDENRILGTRARWAAIEGHVDGEPVGLAVLDAPGNPAHPVPWYASTRAANYGPGWANFLNAAFLWSGAMPIDAPIVFDYRVWVHDGRWGRDRVDAEWFSYRSHLLS